jgi:hypothetical protein
MTMEASDDLIELLDALTEGRIDESGRALLHRMLADDPGIAHVVTDQLAVSQALSRISEDEPVYVAGLVDHVLKISGESDSEFSDKVVGKIARRRRASWAAMAAMVALLTVCAALLLIKRQPAAASVAAMTRFDGERNRLATTSVSPGQEITVEEGLMKLVFANKAVITIEAPARFTILSASGIRLWAGRLDGWCPPEAHGFQVITQSATLTDLGTSFGIRSTADGSSEFLVLSGEVEVVQDERKVRLTEGRAVATNEDSMLVPMVFDPSSFKNTWTLGYGILATRGALVPVSPDVPEKLANLEDDFHVLAIPERRGVPFIRPIIAEITSPGSLPGNYDGRITTLDPVPGMRTTSILLRYNPVGKTPEDQFTRFEGEVTFDRPVLAIACRSQTLEDSDVVFAQGEWASEFRGIELSQINNPPDSVTLSADRRTVKVVFYAGAATDEVRVILRDN